MPNPASLPLPVDREVELLATSLAPCPLAHDHAPHHGDNGLTSETVLKSQLIAFFYKRYLGCGVPSQHQNATKVLAN